MDPNTNQPNRRPDRKERPRVLVVAAHADRRELIAAAIRPEAQVCAFAETLDEALALWTDARGRGWPAPRYEAVVLEVPSCSAATLKAVRAFGKRRVAAVVVCAAVSFDEAVEAMRAGAADVVSLGHVNGQPKELGRRVCSAIIQQRAALQLEEQEDSTMHFDEDAADTPAAHRPANPAPRKKLGKATRKPIDDLATPVTDPADLAGQFEVLTRGELDVETLLRQALEFILCHGGPTNAAIFLPGTSGDYSLGAYVNYTCPKEAAEILLDHLANTAAPRLESSTGVIHLRTRGQVREKLGESLEWMEDCHVLGLTCRADGECLAVITLFRESQTPFTDDFITLLQRLGELFGKQLAKVVRIHHRHLPRDKWGMLGDPMDGGQEGGGGLAA